MYKVLKKTFKGLLWILGVTSTMFLLILIIIWIYSPGKEKPFTNESNQVIQGSIAEVRIDTINGIPQRLVIRGKDMRNPVLLVVHGGPGGYHVPFLYDHLGISVEDIFTVCYWDQRGSGPAYSKQIPDSTITLEQIVDDGLKVSRYLIRRFNKSGIYMEGQSWGTAVGAYMAKKSPELFQAYIGIGQVSNQLESEKKSYEYVLNRAKALDDVVAVQELNEVGPPPYDSDDLKIKAVDIQRFYLNTYESAIPISQMKFMQLFLLYQGLSLGEKLKLFSGDMGHSFTILWPDCVDLDLFIDVPEWEIPVYILQGENDHNTETSLTRLYFEHITAPNKKYFEFKGSGHIVSWENPQEYRRIMMHEVLKTP